MFISWLDVFFKELFLLFKMHNVAIKIKYTVRCNLKCPYCSMNLPEGERAIFEELSVDQWLDLIDKFPFKIYKVILIGGEVFIRKDVIRFVNELTRRKIIVKILSNGTYLRMGELNPSPYLKLILTYHKDMVKLEHFLGLVKMLDEKHIQYKIYEVLGESEKK